MKSNYQDLVVWQKAIQLVVNVYELTRSLPKEEVYGLTSQIRRCAVSIPSNIAEGSQRASSKDFSHFLRIAKGSSAELETQLLLAKKLGYIRDGSLYEKCLCSLIEVRKMTSGLAKSI